MSNTNPNKAWGWTHVLPQGTRSCTTSGTRRFSLDYTVFVLSILYLSYALMCSSNVLLCSFLNTPVFLLDALCSFWELCFRLEKSVFVLRNQCSSWELCVRLMYFCVRPGCCGVLLECSCLLVPINISITDLNKIFNNNCIIIFSSNVKYQCRKKRKLKWNVIRLISLIQCYI